MILQNGGALFVDPAKSFDVIDQGLIVRKLAVYGLSPETLYLRHFLQLETKLCM